MDLIDLIMDFLMDLFIIGFHLRKTFKKVPIIFFSTVEKIKYVLNTVTHNTLPFHIHWYPHKWNMSSAGENCHLERNKDHLFTKYK